MAIINLIGIDPSLTHTGWCIVAVDTVTRKIERLIEFGLIETALTKVKSVRRSSDDVARSRLIATKLNERICVHGVKVGAAEVPSGAQSARAALSFGIAIGILASLPIPLIEVSPGEVKMATVGSKSADKEDIVRWALEQPGAAEAFASAQPKLSSKAKNEWEIEFAGGYLSKKAEHPADSAAAIKAALSSTQFQQLAAMLNSLI